MSEVRYNVIRPTVPRDFNKTSKVGGAPLWAKFKIVFKKSKKGTLPPEFEGTQFYRTMADAKKALADKQKAILKSREARKLPPKVIDPKDFADDVKTRIPGVGLKKISTTTVDNVTTKTYQNRATGETIKKYFSKLVPGEFASVAAATKANNDYRIDNPIKNAPPDLETLTERQKKRYLKKQERAALISERGGYATKGPFEGNLEIHKGHAGNIRGVEKITGDRLIRTPAIINQMMGGDEATVVRNRFTDLDFKIEDASNKIEEIKKSNMSAAKKKIELNKLDTKLMKYAADSDGYKVVTLSDGNTYGGFARPMQSIDPFGDFPGMTEKEIGKFLNKYKNMKVTPGMPQSEIDNIIKAGIFRENMEVSKQAAANANKLFNAVRSNKDAACQIILNKATGGIAATCADAIKKDPVGSAQKLANVEATSGPLAKVKNAALAFLKAPGIRGFGAAAIAGAAGAGLVKEFRNDDPTTYLSNEDQQKSMLVDMATDSITTSFDRPAILDYQLPALGAEAAAGLAVTAPSTIKASKSRALGIEKKRVAPGTIKTGARVLGRGLASLGTPLALLPMEAMNVTSQIAEGDSPLDIATDPLNYLGATFAEPATKIASRGVNPKIATAMRLGMSPTALRLLSRAGGIGLGASLGIMGLQKLSDL